MVYLQDQKSQLGYILKGVGMDTVGIFYGHLEYFTMTSYDLLVYFLAIWCRYFFPFWYVVAGKIWQP
jgi:hypothetical protein